MRTSTGPNLVAATATAAAARLAAVLVTLASWLVFAAPAASAHTVSGAGASNFATTVTGLTPAVDGVRLEVVENGARLRLTAAAGRTIVVDGYENDQYLRLDSEGVWENTRSSAAYLNDDRDSDTVAPPGAVDAAAPPNWVLLHRPEADGSVVALWHDHRAHWMGDNDPYVVQADPDQPYRIYDWTMDLTVDGSPVTASGTLDWVPGPSPLPWFALAVVAGLAVAVAGARPRWGTTLAAATVAVVAADALHAALSAAALAEAPVTGFFSGNVVELAVWLLGLTSAGLLLRRSLAGLYLAASAGFVMALVGGLADVSVLNRSSAPAAGPLDLTRAATALTLGIGLGLVVAAGFASRRTVTKPAAAVDERVVDSAEPLVAATASSDSDNPAR